MAASSFVRPCRALRRELQKETWSEGPKRHASNIRVTSRPQLAVHASSGFMKQLVLGAAATAALGATVITVRKVINQRQQEQRQEQQLGGQQRPRQRDTGGGGSAAPSSTAGGWISMLPQPAHGLGWALQDKDKQLARQVLEIEQQRQRETQHELQAWDRRWALRTKPLSELRALAQRHRIPGRSRMRKQELVAALEVTLGFVPPALARVPGAAEAAGQCGQQQQPRRQQQQE